MSLEENVDIEAPAPEEYKLPHEIINEPDPVDTLPDVDEVADGEPRTIEIPDDPDEFDAFYETLNREERKSLDEYLAGLDDEEIDPEAAQPEDNVEVENDEEPPEGQGEITHDLSQEMYDELPDEAKSYVDSLKTRLDSLSEFEDENTRAGLEALMEDPLVQSRIKQLQGQEDFPNVSEAYASNKAIKDLRLDFEFDLKGSQERLKQHINQAVTMAATQIHDQYKQQNAQAEYNQKFEAELKAIQDLDPNLQSDLAINDPNHPMSEFASWLIENKNNVNMVNLGGVDTYKLFMSKTGKGGFETPSDVRQKVVKNITKAKSQAARTLPRSAKSQSNNGKNMVHGVDVDRFKSDDAYQSTIYDQHSNNPQMIRTLNRWLFE